MKRKKKTALEILHEYYFDFKLVSWAGNTWVINWHDTCKENVSSFPGQDKILINKMTQYCLTCTAVEHIITMIHLFIVDRLKMSVYIYTIKGTLMQIWKSPYVFVFI